MATYIFIFFLVAVVLLFILLPFFRRDKSTFTADATKSVPQEFEDEEDIILDDEDDFTEEQDSHDALTAHDIDVEIEIAVARIRSAEENFVKCPSCGNRMRATDKFCASCGNARQ